jgi:hypothetical protein
LLLLAQSEALEEMAGAGAGHRSCGERAVVGSGVRPVADFWHGRLPGRGWADRRVRGVAGRQVGGTTCRRRGDCGCGPRAGRDAMGDKRAEGRCWQWAGGGAWREFFKCQHYAQRRERGKENC